MDAHTKLFLSTWAITCGAIIALAGIFNIIVDPYRVLGWNSLRSAPDGDRKLKAYEVLRAAPKTVLIGGSRVELGIDARHPAWPIPLRPVYNLALLGASEDLRYRYLQHVLAGRHIELLVLGLDFDGFLNFSQKVVVPTEPAAESRLTVKSDGSSNPEQQSAYVRDLLSLDELVDSVTTVVANLRNDSGGYVSGDLLFSHSDLSELSAAGAMLVFGATDLGQIEERLQHRADTRMDRAMLGLRNILSLCDSQGTQVILFIHPVHADYLEIWDTAGLWPVFEDWKRQLTALTHEYSQAHIHSRISLWDFSGYHSYATEGVRRDSRLLEAYFDPSHYTWTVGDAIIRQIFGQSGPHLGTELTPKNIEAHLAFLREQQQEYRSRQPLDVQRVRLLYEGVVASSRADTVRR